MPYFGENGEIGAEWMCVHVPCVAFGVVFCVVSNAKNAVSGRKRTVGSMERRNFAVQKGGRDGDRGYYLPAGTEDCFVEFIMVLCVLGKGRTLFLSGITEENGVTSLSCQTQ